jgi:Pyridoxamine 5'-phosphate oxidase
VGKLYEEIDERLAAFLTGQKIFFVATAPLSPEGHLNLSPKGTDSFRILDRKTVAYLDLTGSGIETVAHLRENGRVVIAFCAFEGPPKIVRLHGRGEALEPGDPGFAELAVCFQAHPSARSIVRIRLDRIADSCGYGVPLYRYEGERPQMDDWVSRKGPERIVRYQADNNARSIDGLPGLRRR